MKVKISLKEYESHVESMRLKSMAIREEYFARQQELNKKIEELNRREEKLSQEARDFVESKTDEDLLDLFLPEKMMHKRQCGVKDVGWLFRKEVPVYEEVECRVWEYSKWLERHIKGLPRNLSVDLVYARAGDEYRFCKEIRFNSIQVSGDTEYFSTRKYLTFFEKRCCIPLSNLFDDNVNPKVEQYVTHLNNLKNFSSTEIELTLETLKEITQLQEKGGWEIEISILEHREEVMDNLLKESTK